MTINLSYDNVRDLVRFLESQRFTLERRLEKGYFDNIENQDLATRLKKGAEVELDRVHRLLDAIERG